MNIPRPPAHVEPYVTALGAERAVAFFLAYGGADFYVAQDPKGHSAAVEVIGLDGLQALAAIRDRLPARVPLAKPWLVRYLAVTEGLSKAAIARKLHISVPSVTRALANAGKRAWEDPRQHKLF